MSVSSFRNTELRVNVQARLPSIAYYKMFFICVVNMYNIYFKATLYSMKHYCRLLGIALYISYLSRSSGVSNKACTGASSMLIVTPLMCWEIIIQLLLSII